MKTKRLKNKLQLEPILPRGSITRSVLHSEKLQDKVKYLLNLAIENYKDLQKYTKIHHNPTSINYNKYKGNRRSCMSTLNLFNIKDQVSDNIINQLLADGRISQQVDIAKISSPEKIEVSGVDDPEKLCLRLIQRGLTPPGNIILNQQSSVKKLESQYHLINKIIDRRNTIIETYINEHQSNTVNNGSYKPSMNECWTWVNTFVHFAFLQHKTPQKFNLNFKTLLTKLSSLSDTSDKIYQSHRQSISVLFYLTKSLLRKNDGMGSEKFENLTKKFQEAKTPLILKPLKPSKNPSKPKNGFFDNHRRPSSSFLSLAITKNGPKL